MKLPMTVTGTDGKDRSSVAEFVDFCKFEEHHNISMAKIENDLKARDLAWLAWHSEKRRNQTALNFDEWCSTVEGIALDSGETKIVPLEMSQPTG